MKELVEFVHSLLRNTEREIKEETSSSPDYRMSDIHRIDFTHPGAVELKTLVFIFCLFEEIKIACFIFGVDHPEKLFKEVPFKEELFGLGYKSGYVFTLNNFNEILPYLLKKFEHIHTVKVLQNFDFMRQADVDMFV